MNPKRVDCLGFFFYGRPEVRFFCETRFVDFDQSKRRRFLIKAAVA